MSKTPVSCVLSMCLLYWIPSFPNNMARKQKLLCTVPLNCVHQASDKHSEMYHRMMQDEGGERETEKTFSVTMFIFSEKFCFLLKEEIDTFY